MSYIDSALSRNNLIPNASLKRLSKTEWESVDNDPWFELKRHFKSGHYELNINAFSEFTQFGSTPMRVYYSDVSGTFGEKNFVQLPPLPTSQEPHERTHFFHLPHDTDSLRFDPLESPGKFHFWDSTSLKVPLQIERPIQMSVISLSRIVCNCSRT